MENLIKDKKKKIIFDPKCEKDFYRLSISTIEAFSGLFELLERDGYLREPNGKKLEGYKNLNEVRLRNSEGNWRIFYAYIKDDIIILLHLIYKKAQKTNLKDLELAFKRLKNYE